MSLHDKRPGFRLPFYIPGAPSYVTYAELLETSAELFANSYEIYRQQEHVYVDEMRRATWWRFWLVALTGAVVIGLLNLVLGFLGGNAFRVFLALILVIPITAVSVYVGAALSHWWVRRQWKTVVPLVEHAYVLAIAWLFGTIVAGAFVIVIHGTFGAALYLLVSVYMLYVMTQGLRLLYNLSDGQLWVTAAIMWLGMLVTRILLGGAFGL